MHYAINVEKRLICPSGVIIVILLFAKNIDYQKPIIASIYQNEAGSHTKK